MNRERRTAVLVVLAVLVGSILLSGSKADPPTQQQAYGPGFDPGLSLLREIRDEISSLRADIRATAGSGGASLTPLGFTGTAKARCASCHSVQTAEEKGGDFVLFEVNGQLADLRPADARRIKSKVSKGEMPPGGGLSEAEKQVLYNAPIKKR